MRLLHNAFFPIHAIYTMFSRLSTSYLAISCSNGTLIRFSRFFPLYTPSCLFQRNTAYSCASPLGCPSFYSHCAASCFYVRNRKVFSIVINDKKHALGTFYCQNKSALRTLARPDFPESAAFVPRAKLRIPFVS